ncbi:hypothetical protein BHE74_00011380 [Ensete ventricosum]|nr:hypothetical protein BHE74_00011380 [Ensete ventricosum]RZR89737.1 hypothetical protein BHM03_00017513 [Ensete ventricosum]
MDQATDIRQSALALLGDLAKVSNIAAVKEAASVANNACWAIGELAVQVSVCRGTNFLVEQNSLHIFSTVFNLAKLFVKKLLQWF